MLWPHLRMEMLNTKNFVGWKASQQNIRFSSRIIQQVDLELGIMKLVEDGKLDLDAPVSKYLTRWQLPPSEFNNEAVTVRRLLSHTAGLTDGLGYSGFETGTAVQSIEQSLTKASDSDEGSTGAVYVGIEPGSEFKYSGGSYTLLQLLVEEVSDHSFASFMKESIFEPLGMIHSTF